MDFHSGDWSTACSDATKPHCGQRISPFSKSPISIPLQFGHSIIEPARRPSRFLIGYKANYTCSIRPFSGVAYVSSTASVKPMRFVFLVATELPAAIGLPRKCFGHEKLRAHYPLYPVGSGLNGEVGRRHGSYGLHNFARATTFLVHQKRAVTHL